MTLGLAWAVALTPAPADAAGPSDFAGVHATDGYLTTNRQRRITAYATQAQRGIRVARVWFEWSAIEVEPGRYDFSRYDPLMEDAARAGVRVLPVLIDPPAFRSSAPPGSRAGAYPPAQPSAMGDFAAIVVGRYGRAGSFWDDRPALPRLPVHSWQVWNEPNIRPWWGPGPDPAAYTDLARAVRDGIRRCDPQAEVVAAGLPSGNAPGVHAEPFARGMYAAGARDVFDTMALHPYDQTARDVIGQVESFRGVMAQNGDGAPIWITEFGWGTGGPPTVLTVSEDRQADLIAATVSELHGRRDALGVRGFVYYQWADGRPGGDNVDSVWFHVGLVDAVRSPKPALTRVASAIGSMGLDAMQPDTTSVRPGSPCRLTPDQIASPVRNSAGGSGGGGSSSGGGTGGSGGRASGESGRPAGPVLNKVKLRPVRFRAAARGPALRTLGLCGPRTACGRRGAKLSFHTSSAGTLELRFRRLRGRRTTDLPGLVRRRVRAGHSAVRLMGRLTEKRVLPPGRYRAVVQLVGSDGRRSRQAIRAFTVLR